MQRGILNRISEALYTRPSTIYEGKQPEAKIANSQFHREQPQLVTFKQLLDYHNKTPQLQISVSSYRELITGTEMIISSENDKATELIEEWNRKTNFYDKFENLTSTILITGNGILEKLDEKTIDDVEEVDMTTIIGKKRNDAGSSTLYYEHQNSQSQTVKLGEDNMDRFIEFNLSIQSKEPWGQSLFHSLAVPRVTGNRRTAPLIEILWGMEDSMGAMLQNNAYPITTVTYPGANDDFLKKETRKWTDYKPGDKRIQKIKPDIEFFETSASSKYTDYVAHIEKTIEIGTQFPHDILTGDFTSRASSETTETIVMKKVRGFQRYLCNRLKSELYDPILSQNGIDPVEAQLSVAFTAQNVIELEPLQVMKLYTDKAITLNEEREWLRTNTGMDLPDDDQIERDHEERKLAQMSPEQAQERIRKLEHIIENIQGMKVRDD